MGPVAESSSGWRLIGSAAGAADRVLDQFSHDVTEGGVAGTVEEYDSHILGRIISTKAE